MESTKFQILNPEIDQNYEISHKKLFDQYYFTFKDLLIQFNLNKNQNDNISEITLLQKINSEILKPKLSPFLGIDLIHESGHQSKFISEGRDLLQKLVIYGIDINQDIFIENKETSLKQQIYKCLVSFIFRIIILGVE